MNAKLPISSIFLDIQDLTANEGNPISTNLNIFVKEVQTQVGFLHTGGEQEGLSHSLKENNT